MKRTRNILLFIWSLLIVSQLNLNAQTVFTCEVDGKAFKGEVKEALQVSLGKEEFIQVRLEQDGKIMYLYLKAAKLSGALPVKLDYLPYDNETNQTPEAEVVWAPEGMEQPSWNTIEGHAEVTNFNADTKTISGTFNFVVEKAAMGSNHKPETIKIDEGKFENITYKLDVPKKK